MQVDPDTPFVTRMREARPQWHALRIRPRFAARIIAAFDALTIETFYPTATVETRWSDRTKRTEQPWFPGYLFARFPWPQRNKVLSLAGITKILTSNLSSIPEAEIANLQRIAASPFPGAAPCPYVPGAAVKVETGPFSGVVGIVDRIKGERRLFVRIQALNRSVSVELDAGSLKAV